MQDEMGRIFGTSYTGTTGGCGLYSPLPALPAIDISSESPNVTVPGGIVESAPREMSRVNPTRRICIG
jgi:hypothetical protein